MSTDLSEWRPIIEAAARRTQDPPELSQPLARRHVTSHDEASKLHDLDVALPDSTGGTTSPLAA